MRYARVLVVGGRVRFVLVVAADGDAALTAIAAAFPANVLTQSLFDLGGVSFEAIASPTEPAIEVGAMKKAFGAEWNVQVVGM